MLIIQFAGLFASLRRTVREFFLRSKGVGMEGATGALAPAMLNHGGESIFSPPQYYPRNNIHTPHAKQHAF